MFRSIPTLLLFVSIALTCCKQAPKGEDAIVSEPGVVTKVENAKTYSIAGRSAKVGWIGTKVTAHHFGEINISEGTIEVKDANVVGGSFTIDMTTLVTLDKSGGEKLTGHLKSDDFFDVEQYPTAVFEIISAERRVFTERPAATQYDEHKRFQLNNPTHRLIGNLTMHGVTRQINIPAEIEFLPGSLIAKSQFDLNRKDWGIDFTGPKDNLIRDEVHIGIEFKAK